jgi:hypothetical protein
MKKNLIVACGLATLLAPSVCFAGGGDAFVGGMAGGMLGGVVAGSMNRPSSSDSSDRETDRRLSRLEAEKAQAAEAEKRRLEEENARLKEQLKKTK